MPITVNHLDNGTGVLYVGKASITVRDVLEARNCVVGFPEKAKQYRYGLIDYSQVDDMDISNRDLDLLVAQHKKDAAQAPGMFVALVGSRNIVYGLARMWASYMHDSGWETHVFRTREEAEAWIRERIRDKHGVDPTFT